MGKELDAISSIIKKHIDQGVPVQNTWVTVTSVDWSAKTMECKGITDDLEYFDVLLGIGSTYYRPVENTRCLIGTIENKEAASFLIYAEKIKEYLITTEKDFKIHLNNDELIADDAKGGKVIMKNGNIDAEFKKLKGTAQGGATIEITGQNITMNGGSLGDLIIKSVLEANLNVIKVYLDGLKAATASSLALCMPLSPTSPPASAFASATAALQADYAPMGNPKVKHG